MAETIGSSNQPQTVSRRTPSAPKSHFDPDATYRAKYSGHYCPDTHLNHSQMCDWWNNSHLGRTMQSTGLATCGNCPDCSKTMSSRIPSMFRGLIFFLCTS